MIMNLVISHREDADGIIAATLAKQALKNQAEIILCDYVNIINKLENITGEYDNIFICDLGLNKTTQEKFVSLLGGFAKSGARVIYVDHHQDDFVILERLRKAGVEVIWKHGDCASMLVYNAFQDNLPAFSKFLAGCAAYQDHLEDGEFAVKNIFDDRQFLLHEATMLGFAISQLQDNESYLEYIIDELANCIYPHNIGNVQKLSTIELNSQVYSRAFTDDNIEILDNIGVLEKPLNGCNVASLANFVLKAALDNDRNIAMAYHLVGSNNILSLRSHNSDVNLGKIIGPMATKFGGTGGGHAMAAGGAIPKDRFDEFLIEFDAACC